MRNFKKQNSWYGMQHSSYGDVIVVYDKRIIPKNPSRIYLYHTQRDMFIEYDEIIVMKTLLELSLDDTLKAEKDYKEKLTAAAIKQSLIFTKKTMKK
ncbi:hypothetical protein [Francisella frigiditurris]|uniref:Uncharacterized protein n=1 Tax=Francisella frigiditurris TaxID=1542390 RepID=A0A1J0KSW0_9GAMM|nr:hypothetical protein [Francisella frigiditurris]APC96716.1 hypothetical protein KX01_328 [Francisella frigiditurris]